VFSGRFLLDLFFAEPSTPEGFDGAFEFPHFPDSGITQILAFSYSPESAWIWEFLTLRLPRPRFSMRESASSQRRTRPCDVLIFRR
jgi:hypothetical protein